MHSDPMFKKCMRAALKRGLEVTCQLEQQGQSFLLAGAMQRARENARTARRIKSTQNAPIWMRSIGPGAKLTIQNMENVLLW